MSKTILTACLLFAVAVASFQTAQATTTVMDFNTAATGAFLVDPYFEDGITMELTPYPGSGNIGHYDISAGSPLDGSNYANIDDVTFGDSAVRFSMGGAAFDLQSVDFPFDAQFGTIISSTGFSQPVVTAAGTENFAGPDWTGITFFDLAHDSGSFLAYDNITLVPEPSTMAFYGLGMILIGVPRRRTTR